MSKEIKGCFYFKLSSNNNLYGEYTNNGIVTIETESATILTGTESDTQFVGKYDSCWKEGNMAHFAELEIRKVDFTKQYRLEWKEDGRITFKGEGFICDNILIGTYQSI